MALAAVTLDDKYALESGRIFLTGTQALVRLPMMQRQRDQAAGLDTACFVTGYRGSPLGGVFAMWYGKGPGVDRTGDVFRHGNFAGTSTHGGVLLLAGDDHTCKSSTTAHQSEYAFMDLGIPVLNPAGVQEFLDLGLHGWAMSRYSGCWVAFKVVADTVDSSASVTIDPTRTEIVVPSDFPMPRDG